MDAAPSADVEYIGQGLQVAPGGAVSSLYVFASHSLHVPSVPVIVP